MTCPCPKHPFGCYDHPTKCGCAGFITEREALQQIWDIVHTPTKATHHRSAERHFQADFDAIRKTIKATGLAVTSTDRAAP